jgi:colanic acid/amylovoran biosynthesis protein WcaK/AmsJ
VTKILLTSSIDSHAMTFDLSRGGAAVAISTVTMLREHVSNAEFASFIQFTPAFADSLGVRVIKSKLFFHKRYSPGTMLESSVNLVRCVLWAAVHKRSPRIAAVLLDNRKLREFARADVIVHLGTDTYSDDYGVFAVIEHSKDILLGVLLKKPVVIWAESVGPFASPLTSRLVRITLNRVALVTVREEISLSVLQDLGVSRPAKYLTADPAFLLEPASEKRASEILSAEGVDVAHRPLVGVTMAWTVLVGKAKTSRYLRYMKEAYWMTRAVLPESLFQLILRNASRFKSLDMSSYADTQEAAQMIDHIVERLDATVVLLPHDYSPAADDRVLLMKILQQVKHKSHVRLLCGTYSAPELKAVIGQCDLVVSGRMHAAIAALSMHVPTVAIPYGHKFRGIMKMVGQEHYVCDDTAPEAVASRAVEAWSCRESIRAELMVTVGATKKLALHNAQLVADILRRYGSGNAAA